MPVTLTKETGTGTAGTNTYASVADADAYATLANDTTWGTLTTVQKEAALSRAFIVLNDGIRFPYVGIRKTQPQGGQWPRSDAVERNGPAIPDTVIPHQVVSANCELALLQASGDTGLAVYSHAGSSGPVKARQVDVIRREFFSAAEMAGLSPDKLYPIVSTVDGLLRPLLRDERFEVSPTPLAPGAIVQWLPEGYFTTNFNTTTLEP